MSLSSSTNSPTHEPRTTAARTVAHAIEASGAVTCQLGQGASGSRTPQQALHAILRSVHEGLGFDRGIIYMVSKTRLEVQASWPERELLPGEEPFFYELYERALATKISQADLDRLHLLSVAAAQVIASTEDALHGR